LSGGTNGTTYANQKSGISRIEADPSVENAATNVIDSTLTNERTIQGNAMELLRAIQERRSVRKYKSKSVPDEILKEILDAARLAPSWNNTQVWRFVVVKDQEIRARLSETMGSTNPAKASFLDAPMVICVAAQRGSSGYYKGESTTNKGDWFMYDVAIAMEHLVLTAWQFGLGTVHVGLFDAMKAEDILKIPEGYSIVSMTPLGYFETAPGARPRKPLTEIVYLNTFGEPYIT
jgi:nitroreductase